MASRVKFIAQRDIHAGFAAFRLSAIRMRLRGLMMMPRFPITVMVENRFDGYMAIVA